jgi:hypothetical protein
VQVHLTEEWAAIAPLLTLRRENRVCQDKDCFSSPVAVIKPLDHGLFSHFFLSHSKATLDL